MDGLVSTELVLLIFPIFWAEESATKFIQPQLTSKCCLESTKCFSQEPPIPTQQSFDIHGSPKIMISLFFKLDSELPKTSP